MTDYTPQIVPERMPLCPFCDNAMETHEPVVHITAHGSHALAHEFCMPDFADELDEDDDEPGEPDHTAG